MTEGNSTGTATQLSPVPPLSTSAPRALITGGTGFIGSHLAATLLDRGYTVTVLDDMSTGRPDNIAPLMAHSGFHLVTDNICNMTALDRVVRDCDIVFHLAAAVGVDLVLADPLTSIETNVLGTESVLKAAEQHGAKVLIASSSEVYGKCVKLPAAEDDDVLLGPSRNSRWSYAAAKLLDEFLALAHHQQNGLPVVVFRLFNTVGPRQSGRYGMVIPRFVAAALAGGPIPVHGDGKQSRSFLHVHDAIAGIIGLADCSAAVGEIFNIGGSEEITILQLAEMVWEHVGGIPAEPDRMAFIPYQRAYAKGYEDIRRRVADTTKIRRVIGWEPQHSLDAILSDVVAETRRRLEMEDAIG
jgi:UDP-glucose 4-epimerase